MKPLNGLFAFAYHFLGFFLDILHPTHVEGLENLPAGGAMLCANHSSNWDPVVLIRALPVNYRVRTMAKEELFKNPILAWLIRKVGGFPVSRGNTDIKSIKTAMQVIKDGENLLIFPEGTVIRKGIGSVDGLPAHAKGGIAMIGIRTGAVMIPVFMDGEKKPFRRTRIIIGKPYTPVYSGRHGTAEELQKIADDILAAAYALGGQAVGGAPLCEEK